MPNNTLPGTGWWLSFPENQHKDFLEKLKATNQPNKQPNNQTTKQTKLVGGPFLERKKSASPPWFSCLGPLEYRFLHWLASEGFWRVNSSGEIIQELPSHVRACVCVCVCVCAREREREREREIFTIQNLYIHTWMHTAHLAIEQHCLNTWSLSLPPGPLQTPQSLILTGKT